MAVNLILFAPDTKFAVNVAMDQFAHPPEAGKARLEATTTPLTSNFNGRLTDEPLA